MSLLFLLQVGLTIFVWFLLKIHMGVVLQTVFPKLVRQRFLFNPLPPGDEVIELLDEEYIYLGCRVEWIPLFFKRTYLVFYHPSGIYADLSKNNLKNGYLISRSDKGFFLFTRSYGPREIRTNNYVSTKAGGRFYEVAKVHKKAMAKNSLGDSWVLKGTAKERLEAGKDWYRRFARRELFPHALLSVLLLLLGVAFTFRVWYF
jgi:hypothetical protein